MSTQPFILATAGHVDHGKSSIVRALTGTDPDRLPEEKARGITIELGFAHLDLPAGTPNLHAADRYSCGIVDVPGHEDFVRNMVAGVGAIDLAILVVAADDGWMPQTEEHLQILLHLGVTRAVVALAKIDLAEHLESRLLSIRQHLAGTAFESAPIVPVSVPHHQGLDALRLALASTLDHTPRPPDLGRPRLWIDRVFALRGVGTVVTGTLAGGSLRRGDPVTIQPRGQTAAIRACHAYGRELDQVQPGTRVALNLPDLPTSDSDPLRGLYRGDVVTTAATTDASNILDVWVTRSPRRSDPRSRTVRPLGDGALVAVHLGSAHSHARLQRLEGGSLAAGESGLAQLRLLQPLHAHAGDRFILRDTSQQSTLAGGIVLDPEGPRRRARDPHRLALLHQCAQDPTRADAFVELALATTPILDTRRLLERSRFAPRTVIEALGRLYAAHRLVLCESWAASSPAYTAARQHVQAAIESFHRQHPERPGLPITELRRLIHPHLPRPEAFDALVRALARDGSLVLEGATIRQHTHQPALPENLRLAVDHLRTRLAAHPLEPPARRELAPDALSQQALRHLMQRGEVVEIHPDLVLDATVLRAAKARVAALLRQRGAATAGEIRAHLGTTRRLAIPLLERWDREGFTRRNGDLRRLNPDHPTHV